MSTIDIVPIPKKYKWGNDVLLFLSVMAIVFISRLPFLNAGYGNEWDAWRVAAAARSIATSGEYTVSRFPGFPLQEIACSLFWQGGPLALNGATALLSALGVTFFALSLKALGCKDYILASLALAFTPVVYINSTNSMDYLWALAFILGSLYFVIVRRPLVAGIFLGAAIGSRITSGAMLIPLSFLLVQWETRRYNIGHILKFSLTACLVGAAAFVPVISKYGITYYEAEFPPVLAIVKFASVEVWGIIGLFAILVVALSFIFQTTKSSRESSIPISVGKLHIIAWVFAICLYVIAFLRYPHKAAYLIPTVPFVILLLGRILDRSIFIFVCISLLLSSFFFSITSQSYIDIYGFGPKFSASAVRFDLLGHQLILDPLNGPIFSDHSMRIESMKITERVSSLAKSYIGKTVIVAGPWITHIQASLPMESQVKWEPHIPLKGEITHRQVSLPMMSQGKVDHVYLLDATQLQQYIDQGFKVYFLPGLRKYNFNEYSIDLLEYGAMPLITDKKH